MTSTFVMKSIPQKVGLFGKKDRKITIVKKTKRNWYNGKYGDDNHDILGPGMTYWDQRWYDNSLKSYGWYIGPGITDDILAF